DEYDLDEDFFRHQYRCRLYEEYIMDELASDGSAEISEEEAWELFESAPEMYDWREVSVLLVKPYAADGRVLTADSDGNTVYTEEEWATAKATCEGYLEELKGGELFSSLAKMYSDDATSGGGGALTERLYRDTEGYDQAFLDAAFALKSVGDYTSSPVKTSLGYELIYCDAVLSPDRPEEVIAYIMEEQTKANRRSLLSAYMTEKEDTSEIIYYAENWE
ncbi:MAG: peptidylprolyl isomerase, partial [Firmicutes bacterium]|nr:peptidylprolyl isomerase [Bacillota bacterium]